MGGRGFFAAQIVSGPPPVEAIHECPSGSGACPQADLAPRMTMQEGMWIHDRDRLPGRLV